MSVTGNCQKSDCSVCNPAREDEPQTSYDPDRELEDMARAIRQHMHDNNTREDSLKAARAAITASSAHRLLPTLQAELSEQRIENDKLQDIQKSLQAEDENLKRNADNLLKRNTELQAENIELRAEVGRLRGGVISASVWGYDAAKQRGDLQAENERLREAKRCMSEFLSDVATELGTPAGDTEALTEAIHKLQARVKELEDGLRSIAYRPIGGKTKDYFCSVALQSIAKQALRADEQKG